MEDPAELQSASAWSAVPIDMVRTSVTVEEHGAERLYVSASRNLGSARRFLCCSVTVLQCTRTAEPEPFAVLWCGVAHYSTAVSGIYSRLL